MCAACPVDVCRPETTFWNPKAPWKQLRSELREHLCLLVVHPTLTFSLWQIFRYLVNIYSPATSVHLAPNCMQTILSRLCSVCCKKEAKWMSRSEGQTSPVSHGQSNSDPHDASSVGSLFQGFSWSLQGCDPQCWPGHVWRAFPDAGTEYSFHNSNSSGI